MADVLLCHHILGLTTGVVALADRFRSAGHTVHMPDLYGGRVFATIEDGAAFGAGEDAPDLAAPADAAAADLPAGLVHLGVPVTGEWAFGDWPVGVPAQIHGMDRDEFFTGEDDVEAAREIVELVGPSAELFVYPGDRHLFVDDSLDSYDPEAAALVVERVTGFLDRVDRS